MSLRKSFAAALKLLRTQRGFSQVEISKTVVQSHVSQLESALTTATVDVSYELACALSIQPLTLFTLTLAGHKQQTGRKILLDCLAELEKLDLADTLLPDEPPAKMTPAMVEARKKWVAVQEMKAQGLTQAEVRKRLALPEPTVRRLWHRESAGD